MCFSLEYEIIKNINKGNLNYSESLNFIERLYWANWGMLTEYYPKEVNKIVNYINNNTFDQKQTEGIIKLYEGPLKYIH